VGGHQEVEVCMSGGISKTGPARSQDVFIAVLAILMFLVFFGVGFFTGWVIP
jgi:hypothetical protein